MCQHEIGGKCEECRKKLRDYQKQYREAHKEEIREYKIQYRENHKDVMEDYNKQYRLTHKEEIATKTKQYSEIHKDDKREYDKQYQETHKEEIKEYKRRHTRGGNIEDIIKHKIRGSKRADKKSNRPIEEEYYITVEWVLEQLSKSIQCPCCHLDIHLTNFEPLDPLQISINRLDNLKSHNKDNCEVICWGCNNKKGREYHKSLPKKGHSKDL